MNTIKQAMIEALKHSIEVAEAKAEELKKPSQKSAVHMRAAERDFWRKKIKVYKKKMKELGYEC
ncbi:hypothetical protein QM404_06255 [Streptococcus infantis]|uniref:hypothetical protein n=1 Tax=Streptococcus infantis TaxID=68892 RepID=UPI0039C30FF7